MIDRVIDIAGKIKFIALKNCDVSQNKVFIKGALRNALNVLLVSNVSDSSDIRKSFGDAIIKVTSVPKSIVALIASTVAGDATAMAPNAQYAAKIVKQ